MLDVLRCAFESISVAFYFVMVGYHYYRFTFEDVVPSLRGENLGPGARARPPTAEMHPA